MTLETLIQRAKTLGASDIHLEAGLPMCFRIRGVLKSSGEPITGTTLNSMARSLLSDAAWNEFLVRRSFDLAKTISGVRCRINILHSARGIGFAIRLLSNFRATIKSLNLHPELGRLVTTKHHGLIIVSGPTGSGKSSTLAGLIQEINAAEVRHIVTVESPIEYIITPQKSFIRQREVGRDTPSFEQALYDALREDPDVLMVGEMRDAETMRLTLNAAETGHLVLATLHSSNSGEALSRIVASFPSEIQAGISAQLADCLAGVICQRLVYRPAWDVAVPECEILQATTAAKAVIRQGQFSKIQTILETGGPDGNFSFERYREWLDKRSDIYVPSAKEHVPEEDDLQPATNETVLARPVPRYASSTPAPAPRPRPAAKPQVESAPAEEGVIVIPEADDLSSIMQQLEKPRRK